MSICSKRGTRTACLVSSLALLFAAALSPPSHGANRILNPDFANGYFNFWGGTIGLNWEAGFTNSAKNCTWSSANTGAPHNNVQALNTTNTSSYCGLYQRVTGLTPGATYTFSCWKFQSDSVYTVKMAVDSNNSLAAGKLPATGGSFGQNIGQWEFKQTTGIVGATGAVAVYVWVQTSGVPTSPVLFDDFNLSLSTDPIGPPHIGDLTVPSVLSDAAKIQWTVPLDARIYDIRYSTQPIDDSNWSNANAVPAQMTPVAKYNGETQSIWVRGLQPSTTYYFAMKAKDSANVWTDISNNAIGTTSAAGTAPYWAWKQKEILKDWYTALRQDCQDADDNSGANGDQTNSFKWYFGGWDHDCEMQCPISGLLTIVRDPWIVDFLGRLSDHVWDRSYHNTVIDRNIYNTTNPHQIVPVWHESHHQGEMSWNGVGMTAIDYDNPKWLQRLLLYCDHLNYWTDYTGTGADGNPHLHFRTFWFKGDEWDHSLERGEQSNVDNPEDRRLTRAAWYASWRDPNALMPGKTKTIRQWLYELDSASAEDCMKTDWNKPVGVWPNEISYYGHQIGKYSLAWWRMAGSMGGDVGASGEWWWDWRVGFVQSRDAYYELVDQYLLSGEQRFIEPVKHTIKYFSIDEAINGIPPQYCYDDAPWPDYNNPWGGYQYIVNHLYRQATGDPQFDQAWVNHANVLYQVMPAPGAPRYHDMWRSTLQWDTSTAVNTIGGSNPFFVAWQVTKDKEWLARALDEMTPGDQFQCTWTQAMYNGVPTTYINRMFDPAITWNNTEINTDFSALIHDWDYTHIRWLTYNFSGQAKQMPIWLWSLKPGAYIIRHGPDVNGDDIMDSVTDSQQFDYHERRTPLTLTLAPNIMEAWEIVPVPTSDIELKTAVDDAPVHLADGLTVTAVFDGFFYAQNSQRSQGIRVDSHASVNPGDRVSLIGFLRTDGTERSIRSKAVEVLSTGNPLPKPLVMVNRDVGGSAVGYQPGVKGGWGPSNVGLLVQTTGKVTERGTGWILITDESPSPAVGTKTGVKILTDSGAPVGKQVRVTGISACEAAPGEEEPVKVIRAIPSGVQIYD